MTSTDPQQPSTTPPDPAQTDVPAPQETAPADAAVAGPGDDAVVASTTARAGSSVTGGEDAVPVTAVVDPRTVRRAPRFKAFAWTGKSASALAQRGDVVRVRQLAAAKPVIVLKAIRTPG